MLFKDIKLNDRFMLYDQDNDQQSIGEVWNIVYLPQSHNHLTIVHFNDDLGTCIYGGLNETIYKFMSYLGELK
jgi:hypothetical protein